MISEFLCIFVDLLYAFVGVVFMVFIFGTTTLICVVLYNTVAAYIQ